MLCSVPQKVHLFLHRVKHVFPELTGQNDQSLLHRLKCTRNPYFWARLDTDLKTNSMIFFNTQILPLCSIQQQLTIQ